MKYSRFVEVDDKKNALFTFALNVAFSAVAARHCHDRQTSDQPRLPPLHTSITSITMSIPYCISMQAKQFYGSSANVYLANSANVNVKYTFL